MPRTIVLLLATVALGAVPGMAAPSPKATRLVVGEPVFHDPEIVVEKSMPPRFRLQLTSEMPTPGWRFKVDSVETDPDKRLIRAEVTTVRPEGEVAQVLTDTKLYLPLGALDRGPWMLEIYTRSSTDGHYGPAGAMVLRALP